MLKRIFSRCVVFALVTCLTAVADAELLVGRATTSITPELPVAVSGQFRLRIAKTVESPVTANVIALESRAGSTSRNSVGIDQRVRAMLR